MTAGWWLVWSIAGQPALSTGHWLSALILLIAIDLLLVPKAGS